MGEVKNSRSVYVVISRSTSFAREWIRGVFSFTRTKPRWTVRIIQPEEMNSGRRTLDFEKGRVDGVISCFVPPDFVRSQLKKADAVKAPVVAFPFGKRSGFAGIDFDADGISKAIFRLALSRRCVSVGYVGAMREEEAPASTRIAKACAARLRAERFAFSEFSNKGGKGLSDLQVWLEALPKPCCVLAFSDLIAMDVTNITRAAFGQKALGRDVSVVGIGNDELICESMMPKLTSIALKGAETGAAAARILNRMMDGEKIPSDGDCLCGVQLVTEGETMKKRTSSDLVNEACDYIKENACTSSRFNQHDVARHLRVSVRLLQMSFAEVKPDTSILKEIHRARLEWLCRKLKTTKRPIVKLTFECGFGSISRLKAVFAKTYGMSMREYRNANGK